MVISICKENITDRIIGSATACHLFVLLMFVSDADGIASISLSALASRLSVTLPKVRYALRLLEESGLVSRVADCRSLKYKLATAEQATEKPTKQTKKKREPKAEVMVAEIVPHSFVAPEFREVWGMWIAYRAEIKKQYKSEKSAEIGYKQLLEKSNNDPQRARTMVESSIANGYQGLFPEKNEQRNNGAGSFTASRQAERERVDNGIAAAMAFIASQNGL